MVNLFLIPEDSHLRKFTVSQEFADMMNTKASNNVRLSKKIVYLNNGEAKLTLDADEAQNVQTATAYLALEQITASCTKIQNSTFILIAPKPEWYDNLKKDYNNVKEVAKVWNDDLAGKIANKIPNSVLTFVPYFTQFTNEIDEILKKYDPFEDISVVDKSKIASGVTALIKNTEVIIKNVTQAENDLKAWKNNFLTVNNKLKETSDKIITEKRYLAADIRAAQEAVEKCSKNIEIYKESVSTGQVLVGVGSGVAVAGIGLLFVPEPTITKVVGVTMVCVGALLAIAGGIVWGVYEEKIRAAHREIAKHENTIRQLDGTLAALTHLDLCMTTVVQSADTAVEKTSEFLKIWNLFNGELTNLRTMLEKSTEAIDSSEIRSAIYTAKEHWENSYKFSKNLLGLEAKPIIDPVLKTVNYEQVSI